MGSEVKAGTKRLPWAQHNWGLHVALAAESSPAMHEQVWRRGRWDGKEPGGGWGWRPGELRQLGAGLGLQRLPPGIEEGIMPVPPVLCPSLPMMSGLAPIPLPWNTCSNPAQLYSPEYVT